MKHCKLVCKTFYNDKPIGLQNFFTAVKSFIIKGPGVDVIKLFFLITEMQGNKLECSSVVSPFGLLNI
jgi:hypothetical protein